MDIWRYFRLTWVSTYKSLPGRSMFLLVRDAAAPNHPIIGIAALGSSMAQQTLRDVWIGWDSHSFVNKLKESPTSEWCNWVHEALERLLRGIYQKDLIVDGILEKRHITNPTVSAIQNLIVEAARSAKAHQMDAAAAEHKRDSESNKNNVHWKRQAETPLFRSKRAKTLALVLSIRLALTSAGLIDKSAKSLARVLTTSEGQRGIKQLIRLVKAEHVGVDMMDIVVCGAIAPYNALLGGKLMCMMLASPEIVEYYQARYSDKSSIIASSMKGASVFRSPNLALLATTSLYGVGSSQYNRIRLPIREITGDGAGFLAYKELGVSRGYGSYHFSRASIAYLNVLLPRGGAGRKVNSIFGEGVNPLMRKLRDGLSYVGLPADELLRHGNPRVVYGIPLAANFREVLVGLDKEPKYLLAAKLGSDVTQSLATFWKKRWLSKRIMRPDILDQVEKHFVVYPVTHGARVRLPDDIIQDLFEKS